MLTKVMRLEKLGQFRLRVRFNDGSGGVHLVSVPIDYSENTRVLVDELREKLKQVDEPVA